MGIFMGNSQEGRSQLRRRKVFLMGSLEGSEVLFQDLPWEEDHVPLES